MGKNVLSTLEVAPSAFIWQGLPSPLNCQGLGGSQDFSPGQWRGAALAALWL